MSAAAPRIPVVVVVGSSGLLGSAVVARLQELGFHVLGVDVRPTTTNITPDSFVEGDGLDPDVLRRAVTSAQMTGRLVHAVGLISDDGGSESDDTPALAGPDRLADVMETRMVAAWQMLTVFEPVLSDGLGNRCILVRTVAPEFAAGPAEAAAAGAVAAMVTHAAAAVAASGLRIGAVAVPDTFDQDGTVWALEAAEAFAVYLQALPATSGLVLPADGNPIRF